MPTYPEDNMPCTNDEGWCEVHGQPIADCQGEEEERQD